MSGYRPESGRRSAGPERRSRAGRAYRGVGAGSYDGYGADGYGADGYGADGYAADGARNARRRDAWNGSRSAAPAGPGAARRGQRRPARSVHGEAGVYGDDDWGVGGGGWERDRYRYRGRGVESGGWHADDVAWEGELRRNGRHAGAARDTTGGVEGNERLTALTGAVLLVLFAAEGVTILAIHQLLTLHFFIGMLLLGPVLLKVGSTGYRFTRYYSGDPEYRRKGPPAPLLRLLGPFMILLSLSVIGTGIMLALTGPGPTIWLFLHKAAFVLWFGATAIHVLAYLWRLPRLISGDLAVEAGRRTAAVLAGRRVRLLLLLASVLTGLVLALLIYQRAGAWTSFVGG